MPELRDKLDTYIFLFLMFLATVAFQNSILMSTGGSGNILFSVALVVSFVRRKEVMRVYFAVQFVQASLLYGVGDGLFLSVSLTLSIILFRSFFDIVWTIDLYFRRFSEWVKLISQAFMIIIPSEVIQYFIVIPQRSTIGLQDYLIRSSLVNVSWFIFLSPLIISFFQSSYISLLSFYIFLRNSLIPHRNDKELLFFALFIIPAVQAMTFFYSLNTQTEYYWLTLSLPLYIAYRFERNFVSAYTVADAVFVALLGLLNPLSDISEYFLFIMDLSIIMTAINILATNERALQRDKLEIQTILLKSKSNELLGELAGGIAHDFNNTLQAIYGGTELLELEFNEKVIKDIQEKVNMGIQLTNELLNLSRKHPGRVSTFDIDEAISSFVEIQNRILRKRWIIKTELESRGYVTMNRSQLSNILLNLLNNAQDAMEKGGQIIIRTRLQKSRGERLLTGTTLPLGKYVVIEIEDEGVGIPEKTLRDIFLPFYSTKNERGSGLGLSSVKALIEASGGGVDVRSQVDRGTIFTLYIPTSASAPDLQEIIESTTWPVIEGQVSIIEDEESIRDILQVYLGSKGYSVVTFESAEEFMDSPNVRSSGIIITDIILGRMGGMEMIHELRQQEIDTPCIFISGYQDTSIHTILKIKRASYLQKPFSFADLRREMRRLLEES